MAATDAAGLPVAACCARASPHEVKLSETALDCFSLAGKLGDTAYDSDGLDAELLQKYGIEVIDPHSRNRTNNSGRTKAQTPLENRTPFRLAAKFQVACCQS